ncbi:exported hypothetical protein [Vibrio crassostreae]|uniref:Uncharacterized protein n=2 Tax=Vibrio TaxID=662 RepID=A0A822N420_9VIBR|nr:exported hypothetical protein [Vibrio crassostreae]CDT60628.1 exported hypothetical protein [Vibrio coralliirubri]CDT27059.1 exported hypothetical protein [Vibrio crassostreae]CDT55921.1 exported hypothetical protein [Vibrio crassostreae]CDT56726.1 exported hypothetical protein [Vibrio crassostreae]
MKTFTAWLTQTKRSHITVGNTFLVLQGSLQHFFSSYAYARNYCYF